MSLAVGQAELTSVAEYVEKVAGIVLDASKAYLVKSRLGPLLGQLDCSNYVELLRKAKSDASGKTRGLIVDHISTNETSFFRDRHPFDLLAQKIVPDHFERAGLNLKKPLRIWSAACSTGQEVYSIAMTLKEMFGDLNKYAIRILGTDLSESALAYASKGHYSKLELSRGLSADRLARHFRRTGDRWTIRDEIRSLAVFLKANLLEPLRQFSQFEIIFCRNVAIYFSQENRRRLFDRLADYLPKGGVLLIGSTESLIGTTDRFARREFRGKAYYERL